MKKEQKMKWNVSDIPSQKGRHVLITGTAGIGYETALALARAGASVIIAGRDKTKGDVALKKIRSAVPSALVRFETVDLASIKSIKQFGQRMRTNGTPLDALINNAAIMTPPERRETADGFELQFGTNYIGPFVLTSELLPLLRQGNHTRVVTVCSLANRAGKINFDDLQSIKSYKPMEAYAQSKLADLIFAIELERRGLIEGWGIASIAVHPGIASTNLTIASADPNSFGSKIKRGLISLLAKPPAEGAWPTLYAVTSPDAIAGEYYGPTGFQELRGKPGIAKTPPLGTDPVLARRLWDATELLIGERFGRLENIGDDLNSRGMQTRKFDISI